MNPKSLIRNIEQTIQEQGLFSTGETIVVGVSGGADSVALLHILLELAPQRSWNISAAHVNHGLRGEEADEDEVFVRRLCEAWKVPLFVRRVKVKEHVQEFGGNVEAAARGLRLRALAEAAEERRTRTAALAHHGDDQAETVLMRLLRGTGPGGLAGIRPVSYVNGLKLVRPLLGVTKEELISYNKAHGLEWRFDSSNASRDYFRNAVRLDILPLLMKYSEHAAESLRRTAEMCAAEDEYMDQAARERMKGFKREEDGTVRAERKAFMSVHIALQRRMIKIILNSLNLGDNINYSKIERIREAICAEQPASLTLQLSETVTFRRSYEQLEWLAHAATPPQPYEAALDVSTDGIFEIPELGASLIWNLRDGTSWDRHNLPKSACEAVFDADALEGCCIVRSRKPGDRIEPYGLNGTQKVKDMFIDGKLPRGKREIWPILTDRNGSLLWVPGFRRSRLALAGPETKRLLVMRFRIADA